MTDPTYGAAGELARLAARLKGGKADLPALFAFTDPVRTPDPIALAEQLPPGTGLVLRTFGRPDIEATAPVIAAIAQLRHLTFLIAADPELVRRVGAHGIHWPEAQLARAGHVRFAGLQTASAHSPMAARRAQGLVDAVFVSTAFASRSDSASRPLGRYRLNQYARRITVPVFALGGVNLRTIKRLNHTRIHGAAAIDGLAGKS